MPPDRLAELMDGFSQKMVTAAPASAVTDAAVPIYARAFSMEDIQAISQFYESPLGQRMVKALPQVARESEELGVQMEQKGAMNVLQEMSGEYPELKQMLKPQESEPETAPASGEDSRFSAHGSHEVARQAIKTTLTRACVQSAFRQLASRSYCARDFAIWAVLRPKSFS